MAVRTTSSTLTAAQVLILQCLAKSAKPLTREEIETRSGTPVTIDNLGPTQAESVRDYPDTLRGMKLVTVAAPESDEDKTVRYTATRDGEKVAASMSARKIITTDERIPADVLDAAVLRVRASKVYGLELYTRADLAEVRAACGKKYAEVSDDALVRQMANRRKQGAYAEKFNPAKHWPKWYRDYRNTPAFAKIEKAAGSLCTICGEDEGTTVANAFVNPDAQNGNNAGVIVLCPACLKRNFKHLPKIPAQDPRG